MFLLYFTSRIVSSVVAFLYPGYASYKTLSQRPASEEDLERWLMYWSVLGCIVGVEYVAEWLVSWIPFYFPLKTLFLLYLALPQTRGSSYLYRAHLHPFLAAHEPQIDAAVASLRTRVYAFVHARARALWDAVSAAASSSAAADLADPVGSGSGSGAGAGGTAAPPPSLGDPVSGPVAMLGGLWRTYGPAIVATGAAMLRQGAAASAGDSERALGEGRRAASGSGSASGAGADAAERERKRRRLEAELAALGVEGYDVGGESAVASAEGSPVRVRGFEAELRERGSSSGGSASGAAARFEEVEVPSDGEEAPVPAPTPAAQRRGSWFGWGQAQGQAYERVKTD
ncbi:hypothetical protein HETIRDRAFT_156552 [Heterobasidion irregulare TC 32-1]|uniref:Protein YOP1 n=1 Tax=Heterobasidion irregulare (strain TC 32-1) TaxID=747525 RepID=W4JUZ5_HETIT|nr:uncharacterized protein HETIRDRAFT_156552 [Heterobasidion irregulare TC 32-1]ETW77383.1 hypothetical protein HETIRDRAFT_156552 [Heterobasidion irregulare TC 32-1]